MRNFLLSFSSSFPWKTESTCCGVLLTLTWCSWNLSNITNSHQRRGEKQVLWLRGGMNRICNIVYDAEKGNREGTVSPGLSHNVCMRCKCHSHRRQAYKGGSSCCTFIVSASRITQLAQTVKCNAHAEPGGRPQFSLMPSPHAFEPTCYETALPDWHQKPFLCSLTFMVACSFCLLSPCTS